MHRKYLFVASASVLVLATLVIVARTVAPSAASEQCVLDRLHVLAPDEQERCIAEVFGGKQGFVATVEAAELATKHALPPEAFPTFVFPTATATPIGYVPPFATQFEPVPNEGQDWRGTESIWIVGAIQNVVGVYFPFYVWTNEVGCGIGTDVAVYKGDEPFPAGIPINAHWYCPSDGGILTITNVTSPTGIVSFTTDQGQTGAFDLATEGWTLEGNPWIAPPAASKGDPYPAPYPYPNP